PRPTSRELQELVDQPMTDDIAITTDALTNDTANLRRPDHQNPSLSELRPERGSPGGQPRWWITRISAVRWRGPWLPQNEGRRMPQMRRLTRGSGGAKPRPSLNSSAIAPTHIASAAVSASGNAAPSGPLAGATAARRHSIVERRGSGSYQGSSTP